MKPKEDNITIRPFVKTDRKRLALYANNKKIQQNLRDSMPYPYDLKDADFFIETVLAESPIYTFAVLLENKLVGVCGLNLQEDIYRKSCEVGYWVGEPFWGLGIASSALKLITNYAFEELDKIRIFTGVFEFNKASMKVLENCGYQKEGVFSKALIKDGKFYDEVRYARIR